MIDVASNPSEAVENALDLYGNDILRLAFSYLKRREDAEDILQETLIRFMQSAGVFEREGQVKSWLLQVAANLCRDHLRSAEYKRTVAMPEGYDIASTEDLSEGESAVMQAVMALPDKYRTVIHLYYMEGYTTKEIAVILGKRDATVRSLLKRGREKLEKMMKGDGGHAE